MDRIAARGAWWVLFRALRLWADRFMDQFEMVRFEGKRGTVYASISHETEWPDAFEPVDRSGRAVLHPAVLATPPGASVPRKRHGNAPGENA